MRISEELRNSDLCLYTSSCPNCGGVISDLRLRKSLPCTTCLPDLNEELKLDDLIKVMDRLGTLGKLKEMHVVESRVNEMSDIFKKCVGNRPWSIQLLWMRRIARGLSFAMIAPTGIGKTTFGIVISIYFAKNGFKSYIIVPTTMLAMQIEKKFEELSRRNEVPVVNYLVIHSKLPKKERSIRESRLDEGNFDILVTTSKYLMMNSSRLLKHDFKFIFIDDVDAVLRGSKAIDIVLKIAGFSEDDIENALKLLKMRNELIIRSNDEKLVEEIRKLEEYLRVKRLKSNKIVVIASATGNPRGIRVKLFRELLGFEVGARPEFIRNITDLYIKPDGRSLESTLLEVIQTLGSGGLIYVPTDKGIKYAEYLAEYLSKHGIPSKALHSKNVKIINEFVDGRLSVLLGVATYYGVLVRGIDLPEIIRYAVFVGIPRHKIALKLVNLGPLDILRLLTILRDVIKDPDVSKELDTLLISVRRGIRRASPAGLMRAKDVLNGIRTPETTFERNLIKAYELLKKYLSKSEVIDGIKSHREIAVVEENGELYVLIPDVATYVQASGRTSRLFVGGISKGLSVVIVDDERILKGLEAKARWLIDDFRLIDFREVDLRKLIDEVDRDRELIRSIRSGLVSLSELSTLGKEFVEPKTILFVVESPNKARTIARFFGKPSVRDYGGLKVYEVSLGRYTLLIAASGGHLYDLTTSESLLKSTIYGVAYVRLGDRMRFVPIYSSIKRCLNCGYQFTEDSYSCPICGSVNVKDSINVVNALRTLAYEVDEVYIGTDPDTEGEKIGYDIYAVLKPYTRSIRRVEFHEVTRKAILQALNIPKDIELNLVKAQIVRRVEDRWLGFSLSHRLQTDFWRKYCEDPKSSSDTRCIENREINRNLSAGRVQTPVLGWIVKNYEDYSASKRKFLIVNVNGILIEIPLREELNDVREDNISEVLINILRGEVFTEELKPLPPYTTDSILSDASQFLGLPAPQTMQILQELFETGFITYHRTDSTRVSEVGISIAREYLINSLGSSYSKYYMPRTWGNEGAHECIRPTRPADAETLMKLISEGVIEPVRRLTKRHLSVYNLVFNRFIASQSREALVRKMSCNLLVSIRLIDGRLINVSEEPITFEGIIEVLFDGFSKFYRYFRVVKELLPGTQISLKEGYRVITKGVTPLLTQAKLITLMKGRGIGRPSTYAKIIETLFKRNYVIESKKRGYLIPTYLGTKVYYYLIDSFKDLVSEERTKNLELRMDLVENGKEDYVKIIHELYEELINQRLISI